MREIWYYLWWSEVRTGLYRYELQEESTIVQGYNLISGVKIKDFFGICFQRQLISSMRKLLTGQIGIHGQILRDENHSLLSYGQFPEENIWDIRQDPFPTIRCLDFLVPHENRVVRGHAGGSSLIPYSAGPQLGGIDAGKVFLPLETSRTVYIPIIPKVFHRLQVKEDCHCLTADANTKLADSKWQSPANP